MRKAADEFEREFERKQIEGIKSEGRRILEAIDDETKRALERIGFEAREMMADLKLVPDSIKSRLPRREVKQLLAGEIPELGFGISGATTGCGKTMTVAAIVKAFVVARIKSRAEELLRGSASELELPVYWCSWPSAAEELKTLVALGDWIRIADSTRSFERVGLLVLDDLGRERVRGSYVEDFSAGKLDSIIDTRYRAGLPTLFTTNLSSSQLADLYGSGMTSRLLGAAPLVELPAQMVDLRVEDLQEVASR